MQGERTDTKMTPLRFGTSLVVALCWAAVWSLTGNGKLPAAEAPQAEITNGQIRVKLYLPDPRNGFYRGTRFDWSGVIFALEYKGHNYYGPWFSRVDPKVHDYRDEGAEMISSTCSGITGPAEEFETNQSALGWDEAKVGGTFIKIGVGVLRKDEDSYDFVKLYQIVDPGKWSVRKQADSIEFTQELTDPSSGYSYVYRKTVRLIEGKPEMVLEHHLKNTGRRSIHSSVYNHNFLVLDKQRIGPDFSITVPFQIQSPEPPNRELATIRGNQVVYLKTLGSQEVATTPVLGFGNSPQDNEIRIENRKVGAGMTIRGDRPLSAENLWSIRSVLAIEPFIAMAIDPGSEFAWKISYVYYTLPAQHRRVRP